MCMVSYHETSTKLCSNGGHGNRLVDRYYGRFIQIKGISNPFVYILFCSTIILTRVIQ